MKKTPLLLLFSVSATLGFSQRFMHGAGVSVPIADIPNAGVYAGLALTYTPRVNFVETRALSVSVGIPVSIGFTGSKSHGPSYFGSSASFTPSFMLNAPALINLNVGAGSTKGNEKRFGFFVGGGFGYHFGGYSQEVEDPNAILFTTYKDKYSSSYGPAGNVGLRYAVGKHQKNIETRLSYMKAISASKTSVYGIAVLFNF